jgi:hypothetical protein
MATYSEGDGPFGKANDQPMNLFKPVSPTPKQIDRQNRIRAKGRKHFICYTGISSFGLPMVMITTLWRWHETYGWHAPPPEKLHVELIHLAGGLIVWAVMGYLFGAMLWRGLSLQESIRED